MINFEFVIIKKTKNSFKEWNANRQKELQVNFMLWHSFKVHCNSIDSCSVRTLYHPQLRQILWYLRLEWLGVRYLKFKTASNRKYRLFYANSYEYGPKIDRIKHNVGLRYSDLLIWNGLLLVMLWCNLGQKKCSIHAYIFLMVRRLQALLANHG